MSKWKDYKHPEEPKPSSEKLSLLLVDDEENVVFTLRKTFENQYNVFTTSNAQEALEIFKKERPTIIISDQRMPEIDGITLLSKIHEIAPECIKILLTGYSDIGVLIEAVQKKLLFGYINKPWEKGEIVAIVDKAVEMYKIVKQKEKLEQEKSIYIEQLTQMTEQLQKTINQLEIMRSELTRSNKELRESKAKIEEYNQTLEDKVKERTAKLEITHAQLLHSAKLAAVGQLGAEIAHELSSPLGGILGYAQLILEKFKRPEFDAAELKSCQREVEIIEQETSRCRNIVMNLLNFSRRSVFAQPELIYIDRTIEAVLAIVYYQLKLKNIKVILDFKQNLIKVQGVINQLQQVFINIILNAHQAMSTGGELKITAENIIDERTKIITGVKIQFKDTGVGISAEDLLHIFEPFFTTKKEGEGTGLGLSVANDIIKKHKGTMEVDSEVGRGTDITITLPAVF